MIIAIYRYPENGYGPIEDLEVGTPYLVEAINVGRSYTNIYLKERKDRRYNSVQFDFYEDGKLLDIYNDPRFNLFASLNQGKRKYYGNT